MSRGNDGVRQAMQALHDRHGHVTASALVEACAPPDAPGHDGFEWDDAVCGAEYRLQQARRHIRVIKIKVDGEARPMVHVPTIKTTGGSNEGIYRPDVVVAARPDEYAAALGEVEKRLRAARREFEHLESLIKPDDDRSMVFAIALRGLDAVDKALARLH